jgi:magnesium chelatase family protein
MALGILAAMQVFSQNNLAHYMVLGELSLDGRIKPVRGSLPMALSARDAGYRGIIVPYDNRREAAVVENIRVLPATTLSQVVDFFSEFARIEPERSDLSTLFNPVGRDQPDLSDVVGQEHVKRALEVTAAGGHNLLMVGPPGSGKTMLARRLPSIMPPITFEEAVETTKIFSVVGKLQKDQSLVVKRPFRAPHHTISDAGLIGGGHVPRPGEVSLAHNGVLFLDELAEYKKHVLEVMRQPLEDLQVTISRAAMTITYPACFMLVAAMNPCPCGYLTDPKHPCRCTRNQIRRYRSKISGPLLDRIDIHVEVPAVPYKDLKQRRGSESSRQVRARVSAARRCQEERFKRARIFCNAQMTSRQVKKWCAIDAATDRLLETAIDKLGLSARAHNRILKISRTIADLDGKEMIEVGHVSEAIQYRSLDRTQPWG